MEYNRRLWFALKGKLKKQNIAPEEPGIYVWLRTEGQFTYFYVGQAKNLLNRRTDREMVIIGKKYPEDHFEASLRKHKDWNFYVIETCNEGMLDQAEKHWIDYYMAKPYYVTRNELLTGENNIVKSNYKRVQNIENKWKRAILQCYKYLTITIGADGLKIGLKMRKNGTPTALSMKYYNKLVELLLIGKDENEIN